MRLKDALSARFLVHVLVVRPLLGTIFGVNIRGREHLEALDRFILISNHNSHLDTLLLYAALPRCQILNTHAVAAGDYFKKSPLLYRLVSFLFQPIWVDRTERGKAIPDIQRVLDDGGNIILFPEGTRGEPGRLQAFRGGIGRIVDANRSIPVVAAFLEGPERALPRAAPVPIPLWNHVTIAPPQSPQGNPPDITASLQRTLEVFKENASEARQRRPTERRHMLTVAVLGIDGSGKSTLSRSLAEAFSQGGTTAVLSDRVELFEMGSPRGLQPLAVERLRRWINARAKKASSLSRYKVPKLAELLLRDRLLDDVERWYRPGSAFMDGMPALNMTAWAVLYRKEPLSDEMCSKVMRVLTRRGGRIGRGDAVYREFPELVRLGQLGLDRMHAPDATIFLDVPAPVCMQRIAARGEQRQVHETEEKLSRLRDAYLRVCATLEHEWSTPVLVVDGDRDRDVVSAEARAFVERAREVESDC